MARRSSHPSGAVPNRPLTSAPFSPRWRWLGFVCFLVIGFAALAMIQPWASNAEPPAKTRDSFASDRDGGAAVEKPVAFDGKRAMGYLEAVCKIGPRMSGTEGMTKQQELIEKHFKDLGATVTYQRFTARQRRHRASRSRWRTW